MLKTDVPLNIFVETVMSLLPLLINLMCPCWMKVLISWLAEPHRNTWRRICGIDSLMITQKNVMSNKCSASSLNYLSSLCIQATCQKGAFWDMHTCIFQSHSRIRIELPRTFMCKRKIDFIIIFYFIFRRKLAVVHSMCFQTLSLKPKYVLDSEIKSTLL